MTNVEGLVSRVECRKAAIALRATACPRLGRLRRAMTLIELLAVIVIITTIVAAAIPLLSSLPIIGPLFKSNSKRGDQTELMVLITPRLVRPLEPDEVPPLPTDPNLFIDKNKDSKGADAVSDKLEGGAGLVDAPRPDAGKVKR